MSRSLELLTDACDALTFTARKMFGGHGFFAPNGGMFAGIVTDDDVIFKLADEAARADLIDLGGHPWTYDGRGKPMTMSEWIVVPEHFYDDAELFQTWAAKAHALVPGKVKKPIARKKAAARAAATKARPSRKPATKKPRARAQRRK